MKPIDPYEYVSYSVGLNISSLAIWELEWQYSAIQSVGYVDSLRSKQGRICVNSDHIFLVLIPFNGLKSSEILADMGVSVEDATALAIQLAKNDADENVDTILDFTKPVYDLLMGAKQQAEKRGHGYFNSEHLLLAMALEETGHAYRLINNLEISRPELIERLDTCLSNQSPSYDTKDRNKEFEILSTQSFYDVYRMRQKWSLKAKRDDLAELAEIYADSFHKQLKALKH